MKKVAVLALFMSLFSLNSGSWAMAEKPRTCPPNQIWSESENTCILEAEINSVRGRVSNSKDIDAVNPNSANEAIEGVDAEVDTNVNSDLTTTSNLNAEVNGGSMSSR